MKSYFDPPLDRPPLPRLTRREQQSLEQLLQGKTSREIASALGIKPRTVETYVNSLKEKFGCQRRGQLIIQLIQLGFQVGLTQN